MVKSSLYQDAYRVKVYGHTKTLTPSLITEWLTGLPIGTEYESSTICLVLLERLYIDAYSAGKLGVASSFSLEGRSDLDNFYWT